MESSSQDWAELPSFETMSKNYDLNLDLPLIPGKGIGDIEIGEHIGTYFPSIQEKKLGIVNVIAWPWRLYEYILWDSISIGVDVFSGIVVRIEVYNQFRGKYMDQIGIGSSVANLDTVREDLSFGEDRIVVGDGDFIMVTDYDDDIPYIEAVMDNKIERIRVEKYRWSWEI